MKNRINVTVTVFMSIYQWRWNIRHANGKIVGSSSEGYSRRADAFKNLKAVTGWSPKVLPSQHDRNDTFSWDIALAADRKGWPR